MKNIDRSKKFPRYARKKNSQPLCSLYIWPLHSWWPSDALALIFVNWRELSCRCSQVVNTPTHTAPSGETSLIDLVLVSIPDLLLVSPPLTRWMFFRITIVWGRHWDGSTSIANKFSSRHEQFRGIQMQISRKLIEWLRKLTVIDYSQASDYNSASLTTLLCSPLHCQSVQTWVLFSAWKVCHYIF